MQNKNPVTSKAIEWSKNCKAGDYLAKYTCSGLTDAEDTGSRCGYSDETLDALSKYLGYRGLKLVTDDVGLVATNE